MQLVVLGYAFGGKVKHLKVGIVDQDHGMPAVQLLRQGDLPGAVNVPLDRLAAGSSCGLLYAVGPGRAPSSEIRTAPSTGFSSTCSVGSSSVSL